MKSKNIIELNGTHYDAVTGAVVGATSAPQYQTQRSVDGFLRPSGTQLSAAPASQKITVLAAPDPRPEPFQHRPARTIAVHAAGHTPERAKTLVRAAVKRPEPGIKQQAASQGTLQHSVPSLIVPKQSVTSIDEDRLLRASETERSPHIGHHTAPSTHIPVTFTPLAVQPTPVKPEAEAPVAPAPQQTNKPIDMFEQALSNATHYVDIHAHSKQFKKKARQHVLSMAAGTLALLVVAGFVAYQNSPRLQVGAASVQAGVSARMPDFKAAGFTYNGTKADDGKLSVGFKGTQGTYQLVQQPTNWSSDEMIQNLGSTDASGFPTYTTVHAGNTTVYRLANSNATWVANGIWYQIQGTAALSDNQVISLVKNI